MFIGVAKSQNFIAAYLLMAVCAVIFRISGFYIDSKIIIDFPTPLLHSGYLIIHKWQLSNSLLNWISVLLLFFQAIWINSVFQKHLIHYKPSYLTGFFYILFNNIFPDSIGISPVLLANTAVIALMDKLFTLTKTEKYITTSFDMGLLLSIAVILYFPFYWILPAIILALLIFKSFQWRIWVVFFSGFLLPYLMILFYCFWIDDIYYFLKFTGLAFYDFELNYFNLNTLENIILFLLISLLVISLVKLSKNFYKNTVQVRQYHQWLLFCFVIVIVFVYFFPVRISHVLSMLSIHASFLLCYYFLVQKSKWFNEVLFLIISSVVIYSQFL